MIKSLLVGTGGWAQAHADAYRHVDTIKLAGICGHADSNKLKEVADAYEIPDYSLDLQALLEKVQPEILDVACNPHFRLDAVKQAVRQESIRLINLEKPLALLPEDAYEIEQLCRVNGKLLTVNHQKKFLPAWHQAWSTINSGELGKLQFIRATCQGNLLEQGTHLVDMVMYFNQYEPVEWVFGQIDELEGLHKIGASAPDAAAAMISFANGLRASFEFGTIGRDVAPGASLWHQFGLEAYCEQGHLKITLNRSLDITRYTDAAVVSIPSSWDRHYIQALADHLQSLERYIDDPAGGHISDLDHSIASFNVIMAIYASSAAGSKIKLPRQFSNQLIEQLMSKLI